MVNVYPFGAIRPDRTIAPLIAAVPYDVVTAEEAREIIAKNPMSFLNVSRSDALLPPGDDHAYVAARKHFDLMREHSQLVQDPLPGMYLYRVVTGSATYLGLGCCLDIDDYGRNTIRKHELTRYDKEEDRSRHIDAVNANTGPVVLLYRDDDRIRSYLETLVAAMPYPDIEVCWSDGSVHEIFALHEPGVLDRIRNLFSTHQYLYIADGHHRAKSAVNVAKKRKEEGRLGTEATRFMGVLFAQSGVRIHGYSRLVRSLGPLSMPQFMDALGSVYEVRPYGAVDSQAYHIPPKFSAQGHVVHMYTGGNWYECSRAADRSSDPIDMLDVSILQREVLFGILGISDPRGDPRLQYHGGARPLADLEAMVDQGRYLLAFSMQPVSVETVLSIADRGGIMPPKSTWFEPKLLSGLIIHSLE